MGPVHLAEGLFVPVYFEIELLLIPIGTFTNIILTCTSGTNITQYLQPGNCNDNVSHQSLWLMYYIACRRSPSWCQDRCYLREFIE